MSRAIPVLAILAISACATTKVQPIVISAHVLDAAGLTFESVAAGMIEASERDALTNDQIVAWNDFVVRWAAGYGLAVTQWVEAKQRLDQPAADQAVSLLTGLLSELATFQFVVQGARP